jgi:hydroxymethylbilane synthase
VSEHATAGLRPFTPVRIGTRGSALALAQARLVADLLRAAGLAHEIVVIETAGDRRAPDTVWGEGAFVAAIEHALLDGRVDIAVHSAKDVPTDEDPRLRIAAYLPREEPGDALVVRPGLEGRSLDDLAPGSRIGTDSPRRAGFVLARRPDLRVVPLHGNVDTRLRRLDSGEAEALVLAVAGLVRLGRDDRITARLPIAVVPPAPGQGAIAIQVRALDGGLRGTLERLGDAGTKVAVDAERAFLRASGGGCRAPIGALASLEGDTLRLYGGYARPDGSAVAADEIRGPTVDADALGAELADRLGARLPDVVAGTAATARMGEASLTAEAGQVVLVTRPEDQSEELVAALRARGLMPVCVPAIAIEGPGEDDGVVADAFRDLSATRWVVVTSANGARAAVAGVGRAGESVAAIRWAAVGEATARVLTDAGATTVWTPTVARGRDLAETLPLAPGDRVLVARGSLADGSVPETLGERGAIVTAVDVYRTREAPESSRARLAAVLAGPPPAAVVFASGSAVRGLLALASDPDRVRSIPAICIGPETTAEARARGFAVVAEANRRDAATLADLAADRLVPAHVGASA